jgi:hypothetical protein
MNQNQFPCPECDAGQSPKEQLYQELGSRQARQLPCALCRGNLYVSLERVRRYFETYGGSQAYQKYMEKCQESQASEEDNNI